MSDGNDTEMNGGGDWRYLGDWLSKHTREPAKEFPFVVHCFLATLLFGGLGVWIETFRLVLSSQPVGLAGLIAAVVTYFPTLVGPTTLQLVLASANNNDKIVMSFALFLLCIFAVLVIVLTLFSTTYPGWVLVLGLLSSACAVWVWWITNGDDATYKKSPPPDAATGGPVDRRLQGDISGFKV